jgi:hypothetical protein
MPWRQSIAAEATPTVTFNDVAKTGRIPVGKRKATRATAPYGFVKDGRSLRRYIPISRKMKRSVARAGAGGVTVTFDAEDFAPVLKSDARGVMFG